MIIGEVDLGLIEMTFVELMLYEMICETGQSEKTFVDLMPNEMICDLGHSERTFVDLIRKEVILDLGHLEKTIVGLIYKGTTHEELAMVEMISGKVQREVSSVANRVVMIDVGFTRGNGMASTVDASILSSLVFSERNMV